MKKNILFALAVILLAGVIAVTRVMTRTEGATARVEITDAETITLPLDKDGTYEISEGKLPVTLEVSEGRGRCGIGGKRRLTAILRAAGEMYSFCKVGKTHCARAGYTV